MLKLILYIPRSESLRESLAAPRPPPTVRFTPYRMIITSCHFVLPIHFTLSCPTIPQLATRVCNPRDATRWPCYLSAAQSLFQSIHGAEIRTRYPANRAKLKTVYHPSAPTRTWVQLKPELVRTDILLYDIESSSFCANKLFSPGFLLRSKGR